MIGLRILCKVLKVWTSLGQSQNECRIMHSLWRCEPDGGFHQGVQSGRNIHRSLRVVDYMNHMYLTVKSSRDIVR
jgi:hypothetical protein